MHVIIFATCAELMKLLWSHLTENLTQERRETDLPPPLRSYVLVVTNFPCPNMCLIHQY